MQNEILLSNGVKIPHIGLGTYPMTGDILKRAVLKAYSSGYLLFDTSDNYYNEADLGAAISQLYTSTKCKRENLFLVTKVSDELYKPESLGGGSNMGKYFWKNSTEMQSPDAVHRIVRQKIEYSLKALRTDYVDLYLLHWPYPDYFKEIWKELELLYSEKLVRAIGVCNCRERHLEYMKSFVNEFPVINQIESSPLNTKKSLVDYCDENNVRIMIYSPLKSLNVFNARYNSLLNDLSKKYNKNVSQIILRFDIQRGLIPIPKSSNSNRINDNINVFDFVIEEYDMQLLMNCNENRMYMPESRSCPGL